MGQNLGSMSQNQSKEELLFQLLNSGNVEAIKALCREGVNLEWIDKEGKTPLIVACMDSGLFNVARTLIEMGANVNAYRPGRHAGTPLHHAAKRGLENTVLLLLSSGANALVWNDDCHTPLDVARIKGHTNVVRAIENHICYFSGWLREFHGPGFPKALAHQLLSKKIWVVVTPCGSRNPTEPLRLELTIYSTFQDAQPRTVIALRKAKIEAPKFHQSDPGLTIFDHPTIYLLCDPSYCVAENPSFEPEDCRCGYLIILEGFQPETQYKFFSSNEGGKQQLCMLYAACRGIPQVVPQPTHHDTQTAFPVNRQQASPEALYLAMVLSASIQSATEERPPLNPHHFSETSNANGWGCAPHGESRNGWGEAVASTSTQSEASSSGWLDKQEKEDYNGWGVPISGSIGNQGRVETHDNATPVVQTSGGITTSVSSTPSAPPLPDEVLNEGPIHYPVVDFSPVDPLVPPVERETSVKSDVNDGGGSSSCIICWEAPVEGACIPCGHMAGCMACLGEIKAKKGVCPVCRTKIKQVIRLYAV